MAKKKKTETTERKLDILRIRFDGGTQGRVGNDEAIVREYMRDMEAGCAFPPIDVFYDGRNYWLADGFHRLSAARHLSGKPLNVIVHKGGKRDARLFAVRANIAHGKRRTDADKRHAVGIMLGDAEWSKWSDKYIARQIGVSRDLVMALRASLAETTSEKEASQHEQEAPKTRKYVTKHGTEATMKVGNIGKSKSAKPHPSRSRLKPFTPDPSHMSKPNPRTAIELSHDPAKAAMTMDAVFERPYLEALMKELNKRFEGE